MSIEDQGICLAIEHQLNGAVEAGGWHDAHLAVFRELHAIGAFHNGDPPAAELLRTVNGCFGNYKFGDAQQASYSFWMNDLCDVYLELIKPVVYDKSEENKDHRWAAQASLWVAIEAGLRILHPMMPFVTEELWQRLPGRATLGDSEPESIIMVPVLRVAMLCLNKGTMLGFCIRVHYSLIFDIERTPPTRSIFLYHFSLIISYKSRNE